MNCPTIYYTWRWRQSCSQDLGWSIASGSRNDGAGVAVGASEGASLRAFSISWRDKASARELLIPGTCTAWKRMLHFMAATTNRLTRTMIHGSFDEWLLIMWQTTKLSQWKTIAPWARREQYPTEAPVIASVKPSTCFMPKLRFGFLQTLRLFGLPRFGWIASIYDPIRSG